MKPLKIGLAYDSETDHDKGDSGPWDKLIALAGEDRAIVDIRAILEKCGHEVVDLTFGKRLLKALAAGSVDLCFNYTQGTPSTACEAQLPSLLEMMGIPHTGSDASTHSICQDKLASKLLIRDAGMKTPGVQQVSHLSDLENLVIRGPSFVKLRYGYSGMGVDKDSLVYTKEEAAKKAVRLLESYSQPVIVEEFIFGYDVTVGFLGNSPREVLPAEQNGSSDKSAFLRPGVPLSELRSFVRDDSKYQTIINDQVYGSKEGDSLVSPKRLEHIEGIASRVFEILRLNDFGRADFRLTEDGEPYFLEVNPLPSLLRGEAMCDEARMAGHSYDQMILKIVESARRRYGI